MGRDSKRTVAGLLSVGHEAIGLAAELIRTRRPATVRAKADRDPVTDVDLAVERTVRDLLARKTPGIDFLGEEEGRSGTNGRPVRTWAFDPIDGTVNYAAGSPLCAVSLALLEDGQPLLGVVDLPFLGERYWAAAGGGAFVNDQPLHVPDTARTINEAIVALGDFATGLDAGEQNDLQIRLARLLAGRALRLRMLGSAAIDLAWLASGRHHASVTLCNRPWDTAAGVVIAREAGATVADLDGSAYSLESRSVIAAAGRLDQSSWPPSRRPKEGHEPLQPRVRHAGEAVYWWEGVTFLQWQALFRVRVGLLGLPPVLVSRSSQGQAEELR